jgi:hypothetical protein
MVFPLLLMSSNVVYFPPSPHLDHGRGRHLIQKAIPVLERKRENLAIQVGLAGGNGWTLHF